MALLLYLSSAIVAIAALILCVQQLPLFNIPDPFDHSSTDSFSFTGNNRSGGSDPWQLFYHLGGNGPWIPKVSGIVDGGIDPPNGCRVEQVHMMARHGERYPTFTSGIKMLELYQRIKRANVTLQGDLAFANTWEFLTLDPERHFEALVSTGPYAGTLEAFTTGIKLRTRYRDLLDVAAARENKTSFWAGDSQRVIETARIFSAAFFGIDWKELAMLFVIPETADMAANTLTPGKTCLNYASNVDEFGHDFGARMLFEWRSIYIPPIIERLQAENPGLVFTETEIYSMQELCGFETMAKGSSSWCNVFTRHELEQFEYARDLLHFYKSGEGNPYGATMGWLWLNATNNLLQEGTVAGPLFFSFVHDGDINPLVATLQLLAQDPKLPSNEMLTSRAYRTSDLMPMGGRLIFERLTCTHQADCYTNHMYPNHIDCGAPFEASYVRLNINDGIVAFPNCSSGPGSSCPLQEFDEMVKRRGEELGDFGKLCGLPEYAADHITFLHQ